jgi:hypothetical protein
MNQASPDRALETIVSLALEIAQAAPQCTEQALQIADLAGSLRPTADWTLVRDAIEAEVADCDLPDPEIDAAASAVMRALKERTS